MKPPACRRFDDLRLTEPFHRHSQAGNVNDGELDGTANSTGHSAKKLSMLVEDFCSVFCYTGRLTGSEGPDCCCMTMESR